MSKIWLDFLSAYKLTAEKKTKVVFIFENNDFLK